MKMQSIFDGIAGHRSAVLDADILVEEREAEELAEPVVWGENVKLDPETFNILPS